MIELLNLKLKSMDPAKIQPFIDRSIANYKRDKIRSMRLTPEQADVMVQRELEGLWPETDHTPRHYFCDLIDRMGLTVGQMWYWIDRSPEISRAYVMDVFVDKKHRGHGYGKHAMNLLEERLKKDGIKSVGLHVFGFNIVATGLYKSLGYNITGFLMEKKL